MMVIVKDKNEKNVKFYVNPSIEFDLSKKVQGFLHNKNIATVPIKVNEDYYNIWFNNGGYDIIISPTGDVDWCIELKESPFERLKDIYEFRWLNGREYTINI